MNVLLLGKPFGTPGEPLAHYRSARGHNVRTLATTAPADYLFAPGESAEAVLARVSVEWPVDLLLCWCPEICPPPARLEAAPCRTAAIVSDWTVYAPQLEHNLGRYDVVLADRAAAELWRPGGITPRYFAPVYSQRSGVHRDLGRVRDIDIAFAGNLNHAVHTRRTRLLERIAAHSDRWHIHIASELNDTDYTELLSRARIVFNTTLRGEMNLRCFEALACGALLFVEADNREAPAYLRDGIDAVFYTDNTLVTLLERFLNDEPLRAQVAANGAARVPALAGEARLDAFLDYIAKAPPSGRPFVALSGAERTLADALQHAGSSDPRDFAVMCAQLTTGRAVYPDAPAFLVALAGAAIDTASTAVEPAARVAAVREAGAHLQTAAERVPDAAVTWLNLALVMRYAGQPAGQRRCLERALAARGTQFGGLLMGARRDPYYARWRNALAHDAASIDMLHAAAHAALAEELRLIEEWPAAIDHAHRAIALLPGLAPPYATLARVYAAQGALYAAIDAAEQGLPHTAFDSPLRFLLAELYDSAGRTPEAHALLEETCRIFAAWPPAAHVVAECERHLSTR